MRGVAGQEHAAIHEAVGHGALAHPEILVLDRVGDVAAHAAAHQRGDVGVLQPAFVEIDELEPPQILAVDDREKRPRSLRPDEDVAERLALVVLRVQIGNAEIDRSSTSRCAARRGSRCRAARAPCWQSRHNRRDIWRARFRARPLSPIAQRRRHAVRILHEALELGTGAATSRAETTARGLAGSDRTRSAGTACPRSGLTGKWACSPSAGMRTRPSS